MQLVADPGHERELSHDAGASEHLLHTHDGSHPSSTAFSHAVVHAFPVLLLPQPGPSAANQTSEATENTVIPAAPRSLQLFPRVRR